MSEEKGYEDSWESPIMRYPGDDEGLAAAYAAARETFCHYMREMTWENRRIIPGNQLAMVKARFDDDDPDAEAEHMWVKEAFFDGREISGVLNNQPNWLKKVNAGDPVTFPLDRLSDWLIVGHNGAVYGGYTIQYMRGGMDANERAAHDQAWGLEFGDPDRVRFGYGLNKPEPLVPEKRGLLGRLLGRGGGSPTEALSPDTSLEDHPMACNMAPELIKMLEERPQDMLAADAEGWTVLHSMALGGSAVSVDLLLRHGGVDPNAKTAHGMTPLALAESLGWDTVCDLIRAKGGR